MIRVHSYESLGTYDGPGIRLVVFLQGCPFRCLYCANPDTIGFDGGHLTAPEEILRRAVNEQPFFGKKGGVTFSGGEPTAQAKELLPLFKMLKENGIHICVDTNGGIRNGYVEKLLSLADLVLLDIKEMDPKRHRILTGQDNSRVLETAQWMEKTGKPFWLRYVLVPGLTDFTEDLHALGKHFKDFNMLQKVDILPYHTLGAHKYEALGKEYQLKGTPLNTSAQLEEAKSILEGYFNVVTVC